MIKVKFGNRGLIELTRRKYLTEQEAHSFSEAYSFLLRVRNELHFLSKRPVDTLHLEKQPEVALGLVTKKKISSEEWSSSWAITIQMPEQ